MATSHLVSLDDLSCSFSSLLTFFPQKVAMARSPHSHYHTTVHVWRRATRQATFRYTTLQIQLYRSVPSRLLPFPLFILVEKKATSKVLELSASALSQDDIQRLFQPTYTVLRSIILSAKSSSLKHQTFFEF